MALCFVRSSFRQACADLGAWCVEARSETGLDSILAFTVLRGLEQIDEAQESSSATVSRVVTGEGDARPTLRPCRRSRLAREFLANTPSIFAKRRPWGAFFTEDRHMLINGVVGWREPATG